MKRILVLCKDFNITYDFKHLELDVFYKSLSKTDYLNLSKFENIDKTAQIMDMNIFFENQQFNQTSAMLTK